MMGCGVMWKGGGMWRGICGVVGRYGRVCMVRRVKCSVLGYVEWCGGTKGVELGEIE